MSQSTQERALWEHAESLELTDAERHAIRLYQAPDLVATATGSHWKWHELINRFLRDTLPPMDQRLERRLAEIVNDLQSAVAKSLLPCPLVVWRGVCDGLGIYDLERHVGAPVDGRRVVFNGMASCSTRREIAEDFASFPPVTLFEITIPAGSNALWVPPWGRESMRRQNEILLDDETELIIRGVVRETDETTRVVCEVVP